MTRGNNHFNGQVNRYNTSEDETIKALGALSNSLTETSKMISGVGDRMKLISDVMKGITTGTGDYRKSLDLLTREENNLTENVRKRGGVLNSVIDETVTKFKSLISTIAETSDRYAELSNKMIQSTGASGSSVRNSRDEIVHGVVNELNMQTGGFFNPEKSYAKMLEIANAANVGSIEAIEELARPMLLATESMNVNQNQLATLLNKWYTRYNFSSHDMESMIDDIRGNTANNNATAEAYQRNLDTVQSWMAYYANGDSSKLTEWSKSLSSGTSWLESMNVDTSRYAEYMKKIMTGEALGDTSMINLLGYAGLTGADAQSMAASGQMEELMKALFDAESNMFASVMNDTSVKKQVADVFGQDIDNLVDAYNARYNNANYVELEDFEKMAKSQKSSEDTLKDMYVTWKDKMKNIVSEISEFASETHMSDILSILTSIYAVLVIRGGFGQGAGSKGLGAALKAGGANLFGGGLTGGGALAAGALGTLGVAGGALAAGYGFSKSAQNFQEGNNGLGFSNLLGGGLAAGGAGTLAASMLGVGAASGPVGWGLLAAGGAVLLGSAIVEEYTEVKGNAAAISKQFSEVEDDLNNLHKARKDELDSMKALIYSAEDASTALDTIKNSDLFTDEEKKYMEDHPDAMIGMVDQKEELYSNLTTIGQGIIDDMNANMSQSGLDMHGKWAKDMKELAFSGSVDQISEVTTVLSQLTTGELRDKIVDAKTSIDLWSKELAEYESRPADERDLGYEEALRNMIRNTYAGLFSDTWFWQNNNLTESEVSLGAMRGALNAAGLNDDYLSAGHSDELSKYILDLVAATTEADFLSILSDLEEKGLKDELIANLGSSHIYDLYNAHTDWDPNNRPSYSSGSNYIDSDQVANIHEGEAVVPKKYNPSANVTELEMLRKYYQDSSSSESAELTRSMKEFTGMLSEIKEFLEYWREDNNRRSATQERLGRMSYNTMQIAQYKMT